MVILIINKTTDQPPRGKTGLKRKNPASKNWQILPRRRPEDKKRAAGPKPKPLRRSKWSAL